MKKGKIMDLLIEAGELVDKKSPAILTGLAVCGLFMTTWIAYKSGSKVEKILKKKKKDLKDIRPGDIKAIRTVQMETVKEIAPIVAPVIIMGGATTACIFGSNSISSKRIAAVSAAYAISENAVKDLNGKMVEMLGEKKTRSIKDAIVKDKLEKDLPISQSNIIVTGDGNVLCKDLCSGRPFYSNPQKIQQAVNKISHQCASCNYVSLNDFYDELNLERTQLGYRLGWRSDDLVQGTLPIYISAQLTDENNPCLCIDCDAYLRNDYQYLH